MIDPILLAFADSAESEACSICGAEPVAVIARDWLGRKLAARCEKHLETAPCYAMVALYPLRPAADTALIATGKRTHNDGKRGAHENPAAQGPSRRGDD